MATTKMINFSPGRILLASFLFVISIGAILLSLPQARLVDISLLDIIFTSTSATCVTGLIVVPISYFTFFGKCVILTLVQIGGLSLITLSFFFISLFLNMGMATKLMAGQILELEFEFWGKVKTFLKLIIGVTFLIELVGAVFLYFPFRQSMDTPQAVFYAVFHSVTAFCNSGITLYDNNLINYANSPITLTTISFLVFSGGIGFIVWYEMIKLFKTFIKSFRGERKICNISLHTKLVLWASIILIIIGAILIWGVEKNNTLKDMDSFTAMLNSFFMSTTVRSAGFNTFRIEHASLATLLVLMILMVIGASPNSAGAGIKTTTFLLLLATVVSISKGKNRVEIMGRTIPIDQIYRAMVIIFSAIAWILVTIFILLLTDPAFTFIQVMLESISAFSTAGLSGGISPYLSSYGKILILISMLVGRIGSLTLVLALRRKKEKHIYKYPEERIVIG